MNFSQKFSVAFERTLKIETGGDDVNGGYTNDPHDPGGETKWGVAKRYHPDIDIKNLTKNGAREIYYNEYWLPLKLDSVNSWQICAEMFDTAVNSGVGVAAKIAQGSLIVLGSPVSLDGAIGPQTVNALNAYKLPDALLTVMNGFQFMMFCFQLDDADGVIQMIKKRKGQLNRYLAGWTKRLKIEQL